VSSLTKRRFAPMMLVQGHIDYSYLVDELSKLDLYMGVQSLQSSLKDEADRAAHEEVRNDDLKG
jgi:hypothetical protein